MGGMEFSRTEMCFIYLFIICTIPLSLPRAFKNGKRKLARRRERKRDERPPKLTPRDRTLTLPLRGRVIGERRVVCTQLRSLWFKLPREIRDEIYAEVVGSGRVEVVVDKEGKLRSSRARGLIGYGGLRIHVLPLLQTCRRVYTELIPLLYSKPTFSFSCPITFLIFSASILPHRLSSIQYLYLDFDFDSEYGTFEDVASFGPPSDYNPDGLLFKPMEYYFLHAQYKGEMRNPCLPNVEKKDGKERQSESVSVWQVVHSVLNTIQSLRELRVRFSVKWGTWKENKSGDGIIRQSLGDVGLTHKGKGKRTDELRILIDERERHPMSRVRRWVRDIDDGGVEWIEQEIPKSVRARQGGMGAYHLDWALNGPPPEDSEDKGLPRWLRIFN